MMQKDAIPTKPAVRWWWFAGEIQRSDIDSQLQWVRTCGFGGIEIAWIYPSKHSAGKNAWLGPEWQELVAYAAGKARKLGLSCDFTFGTLWPFGGRLVPERYASKTHRGLSEQRLERSWEEDGNANPGLILNHLDRQAMFFYGDVMARALAPAHPIASEEKGDTTVTVLATAFFCDSWEVEPEGLWTDDFGEEFFHRFGYRIEPHMGRLDDHVRERFDYRTLIGELVVDEFYRPFAEVCHKNDALARVQSHGAPTDLLHAYTLADIPESEALLFDPSFSLIPASAAAVAGHPVVSCESFSCLYGWNPWPEPGPHLGEEIWSDIVFLAHALYANGINHIIWHGMPFSPPDRGTKFYATIHVGPDSSFAEQLPGMNAQFTFLSEQMRRGESFSMVAVYLPLEDAMMKGWLPEELRRPSANWHWEMQYQRLPSGLKGYRPIWTSKYALSTAEVLPETGHIRLGEITVEALYIDVEWMSGEALRAAYSIASAGGRVVLRHSPKRPGRKKDPDYDSVLRKLEADSDTGITSILSSITPIIEGDRFPDFWCRKIGSGRDEKLLFFFAHPDSAGIRYPMEYGASLHATRTKRDLTVHFGGTRRPITVTFDPYSGALIEADRQSVRQVALPKIAAP